MNGYEQNDSPRHMTRTRAADDPDQCDQCGQQRTLNLQWHFKWAPLGGAKNVPRQAESVGYAARPVIFADV